MTILCTFPGKYGDLLWALPTVRAISRRIGQPVDLVIAKPFASICPLIARQSYINRCVAISNWQVQDTAPISPRTPPLTLCGLDGGTTTTYDGVIDLGYRDWPTPNLVRHTLNTANAATVQWQPVFPHLYESELALDEPWITVPSKKSQRPAWICGFTDEFFELKYGLYELLGRHTTDDDLAHPVSICTGPRWTSEGGHAGATWDEGADLLARTRVFLGDCSAWHVLAVAMGVPVVLMEPQEMRWNPVFYPLGQHGPQVTLVRGIDGQPTFDARHVADALDAVLTRTRRRA